MTASIVANGGQPTLPGSRIKVVGSGFPADKVFLTLDGVGKTTNVFGAPTFEVWMNVSTTVRVQTIRVHLKSTGAELARTTIAVQKAVPPPVEPPPTGIPYSGGDIEAPGTYLLQGRTIPGWVDVRADDVTIVGPGRFDFLALWGTANTVCRGVSFGRANETPIRLYWGDNGKPIRNALFDQISVVHEGTPQNGIGYSSVSSGNDGPVHHEGVTFRRSTFDQGTKGWGGIEVWKTHGLVIEDSTFRGRAGAGAAINSAISIPRSDGAIVQRNTFDLTGAFWGVELADIDDVQVLDNIATGVRSDQQWRAFVQIHPGSGTANRITIKGNRLTDHPALFNSHESLRDLVVTDNCLNGVGRLYWGPAPASMTAARNGACP